MKTTIFSLMIAAVLSITGTHTASANDRVASNSVASYSRASHSRAGEPTFKGSENFAKAFPEAMVKSYETKDGHTKVTFTWNGDALEAFYDLNGNLLATSHFLNVNNLPISIQMKVSDSYKDYTVVQAVEFNHTDNGLSYFLMLKKEDKGLILQIDAYGATSVVKRLKN